MAGVELLTHLPCRRWRAALLASTALALASSMPATGPARAQDATWLASPGTGDFTTGSNWDTGSVPTGTATFGSSATTALTLGTAGSIGGWTFNAGASNYTFGMTAATTFTGAGIAINGGGATITVVDDALTFTNNSSAGNATLNYANTSGFSPDSYFRNSSTAGNATININGLNRLTFVDTSTAGNATITIDNTNGYHPYGSGILLNNNATLGNSTVFNNGYIYFQDSTSAGSATIINSGAYIFFYSSSTAGNATITNNTSLNFWTAASAGTAHITNAIGGRLDVVNNSTLASATVINSGQMVFGDGGNTGHLPTAGQATITNNAGGTIEFGRGSTAGSATITNVGTVSFSTLTMFNGTVLGTRGGTAGDAQLINNASGAIFDFSGSAGVNDDGKVSAGSIAGNGTFSLGANELTVGSNNLSTNVTGVIADGGASGGTGGSLVKTGAGTLTLSATNTYTGATIINDGALVVNGSIAASSGITINNGGALGGTGIVGNTTIASGGALAPGNSIGTLTVSGNLAFSTGAAYMIEISPTAADRTNVTGTATLTGATVQAVALPGSFRSQTYTILNATGGLGGTQFAGLTLTGSSISPGARNPHLTYDLNNVYLVLDPGTIQLPAGASGNEVNVAGGINKAVESGATPPAAFDALLNMTGAQLTNALNQVSGQPATGGATSAMQMTTSFLTLLLNPNAGTASGTTFGGARSFASEPAVSPEAAAAYAAMTPRDARLAALAEPRWSVWGQVYGGYNNTDGDTANTTARTIARTWGLATGFDHRAAPDLTFGFALAGGSTNWGLSQGLGGGKSDVLQIGAYGRKEFGPAYLSAALSYAWHNMSTDRTVTVAGADKLTASFDAHSFGGRIEAGYRFAMPRLGVTPYAALQVQAFRTPSYSESAVSGSNAFALAYDARSTTVTRTELGAWFDNMIALDRGNTLALRSRAAWAHDHSSNPALGAVFQTLPGSNFTVNGAQVAANSLLTSLGAELRLASNWSVGARFDGEFASGSQTYAGTGTVRYAW